MAEQPGKAQNQSFQSPEEEEVEIEGKNLVWRSSHFGWKKDKFLKAQYYVQEQEDTFKLGHCPLLSL